MNDIKTLTEQKNANIARMTEIKNTIEKESRALTADESAEWERLKAETDNINKTIEVLDNKFEASAQQTQQTATNGDNITDEQRAFVNMVRSGNVESRAFSKSANGILIPTSIATQVIEKVKEICPIYRLATLYKSKGILNIPVYDESDDKLTAAYINEFDEVIEHSGKFKSVTLTSNIAGTLTKISKSLINNTDFDALNYIVNKVAETIAEFIEKESLTANDTAKGICTTTNIVNAASANAITADELIDVQMAVPSIYQAKSVWIMNTKTLAALRKLKDNDGQYIFERNGLIDGYSYTILGKPVLISDSMPDIGAGNAAIAYGDMSGLAIKLAKDVEIDVLKEKYATQYAIGVCAFVEFDCKVANNDKIAVIKGAE